MDARLQSAMEYLMTYGWAILIIAVVLGALFQLGVFGSSQTFTAPSCLVSPGYICNNPIMNTSGYLGVTFGQIGTGPITLTGMGCTTNSTTPSITQLLNLPLNSGSTSGLAVSCPIAANSIGTGFKGFLWIRYDNPTQSGIIDRIGVVSAKVATAGSVLKLVNGGSGGSIAAPFSANGGTVTFAGGNEIHTFSSSGTFTVTGGPGSVAVLVVAGGGGGGSNLHNDYGPGGGGGGGIVSSSSFALTSQAYSVTVGPGGGGGTSVGSEGAAGSAGTNSIFSTIIANGGGGGGGGSCASGCGTAGNGIGGGSGGGGLGNGGAGGSATAGQGNTGGTGQSGSNWGGGGGWGAGGTGNVGGNSCGGTGGNGISSNIIGIVTIYGGGGGGGYYSSTCGSGGSGGGGGNGGATGGAGTPNTGGGGGGSTTGGGGTGTASGGSGGSGIVIISFNALGNGTP